MTYPNSVDVSAGQPTASAHYNNLRADALRLGASVADGVNIGSLFSRYVDGLTFTLITTSRIRVPATITAPVAIVIDGVPLQATSYVDLPAGSAPSGAANTFYIFAVRSPGSTTFTLDVNTSPGDSTGRRNIGSFYWSGTQILESTLSTSVEAYIANLLTKVDPTVCEGRLTASSGVAIPTGAVSGGTIYFTPAVGNKVALYNPALDLWQLYTFAQLSLNMSALAVNSYDIFIYDAGSTGLTLEYVAWSSGAVRGTALAIQNGVLVRNANPSHRYLGTVYLQITGTIYDDETRRFVWNYYNRVHRSLLYQTLTNTWNDTTNGWAPLENVNFRVNFVVGLDECLVNLQVQAIAFKVSGGGMAMIGIGLDTSIACSSQAAGATITTNACTITGAYIACPGAGMHFLQAVGGCSAGGTTVTYYGDNGVTGLCASLAGFLIG
jgi:hypothetical protein